jgi:hypothetical protein
MMDKSDTILDELVSIALDFGDSSSYSYLSDVIEVDVETLIGDAYMSLVNGNLEIFRYIIGELSDYTLRNNKHMVMVYNRIRMNDLDWAREILSGYGINLD